jgi:hypothetical protein
MPGPVAGREPALIGEGEQSHAEFVCALDRLRAVSDRSKEQHPEVMAGSAGAVQLLDIGATDRCHMPFDLRNSLRCHDVDSTVRTSLRHSRISVSERSHVRCRRMLGRLE